MHVEHDFDLQVYQNNMKIIQSIITSLCFCSSLVTATAVFAQAANPKTVISENKSTDPVTLPVVLSESAQLLKNRIAKLKAFTADFEQNVTDSQGELVQMAKGKMKLQQPLHFYWETLSPDENLLVSDGDTVWFFDPFVEQVTAFTLSSAVQSNPIMLLLQADDQVWAEYKVKRLSDNQFAILVTDEKARVESLTVEFDSNINKPELKSLKILDSQAQTSFYRFSNFTSVNEFTPDTFKFEIPEGADLDDQRQAQ